jgi:hypothetical protein
LESEVENNDVPDYDIESSSSDEEESCSCGRTCKCERTDTATKSPKPERKKWTEEERRQRINELLLKADLDTPEKWFDLLNRCMVDELLDNEVDYQWGVILQADEVLVDAE